jgi:hypothetical protein
MKILVLVIASDQTQQYIDMQTIWRSRNSPADFDVWLVKSMSADRWIWEDTCVNSSDYDSVGDAVVGDCVALDYDSHILFVKQDETFIPGILNKTIVALEYFLKRVEYTHIWRTNLSSVLDFNGLRTFLQSDVGRRCSYAGFCGDGFASGAGFLMIREVAFYLIENRSLVLSWDKIDDVSIGRLIIPVFGITHIERLWVKSVDDPIYDSLLDGIFHFRCESYKHANTITLMKKVCDIIDYLT